MALDWRSYLAELKPDVDALMSDRVAFSIEHQRLMAGLPPDKLRQEALPKFRGLSFEATQRWFSGNDLDQFLQLAIIDGHDAAVDAASALQAGAGPASIALLRRQYEVMLVLVAGWLDSSGLEEALRRALAKPFNDDRYTGAARAGILGSVMPKAATIRNLGLAAQRTPDEIAEVTEIEAGLASFGHGGLLSSAMYMASDNESPLDRMLELATNYDSLVTHSIGVASAAASQIARRLGYAQVYGATDSLFGASVVDARENDCIREFDRAFPLALDVLWAVYVGLNSLTFGLTQLDRDGVTSGQRREVVVLIDGLETAWLATEYLFRGRLAGAATLTRRVFELALESQAWLRKPNTMAHRLSEVALKDSDAIARDRTMPAATTLIRWLHGEKSAVLQRETYSTVCSVAHGGIQAHEYLIDQRGGRFVACPAPHFAFRHDSWLLGTLISGVDMLLGAGLAIAGRRSEELMRDHAGYLDFFRSAQQDIPGLNLIQHLDLDEIDDPTLPDQ